MTKLRAVLLTIGLLSCNGVAWDTGDPIPEAIAPIKAPFDMPQLKRPVFPDKTFSIEDYGARGCQCCFRQYGSVLAGMEPRPNA